MVFKKHFTAFTVVVILILSVMAVGSTISKYEIENEDSQIVLEVETIDEIQSGDIEKTVGAPSEDTVLEEGYPFPEEYPTVQQLNDWYDDIVDEYPEITKNINIGESYEGRDMWVIKVSDDVEEEQDEPSIFIHGNLHTREWSTNQASAYFLWRLVEDYGSNDTITWLVDNRQIYVAPMTNPDGYIYDGEGDLSQAQGWRKNRNDSTPTEYVGVDLNRNWATDWENGDDNPWEDTYRGEAPFSEYETRNLRDFILEKEIDSYQDMHSHAGTLLIPWCYTSDPSPHDDWYRDMAEDMTSMTSLLGDDSQQYSYGQPSEEIGYSASGGSIDWVYDDIGAVSLCYELYTPDDGMDGFYPDEEYIMDINLDVYDSLVYQARIADIDLGDGTEHLYPPSPYIVYGTVEDEYGNPYSGIEVEIENLATGETISIQTDHNGYYELNFGTLVEEGYSSDDTFEIRTGSHSEQFTIADEWGQRKDMLSEIGGDPPEVVLNRPDGGETFDAGDIEEIEWTTEEGDDPIDSIHLSYSTDNGNSWDVIENDLEDTGTYDWIVPNEHSSNCLVKVQAVDEEYRFNYDQSSDVFEIMGVPPDKPENLQVEHHGVEGNAVENHQFVDGYEPWELTRDVDEGEAGWDGAGYQEGGSIKVSAEQVGSGTSTEESYWEQELIPLSNEIKVDGAFRRNIELDHSDCSVDQASIEILLHDTGTGWESVIMDDDSSEGDTGWEEFETTTYDPEGQVDAVRISMAVEAQGHTEWFITDHEALGELWVDHLSLSVEDGDLDHNLLTWDASPDDPEEVSHYHIYRSEEQEGPWDEPIDDVEAEGLEEYEFIDINKGEADDIYWWYVVRAVGENGIEEENEDTVQEPDDEMENMDIELFDESDSDGWNFVSFNLELEDTELESILEHEDYGISDNYDRVMYYDAGADEWYSYVPGRADHFNTLENWDHTMGVWIRMTADDVLTTEGQEPTETTIILYEGWNMVGYAGSESGTGVPDQVTQIGYFDASEKYNVAYTTDVDGFFFTPGEGYWVYAEQQVEWIVEY